jgi:hypothetical protein
VEIKKQCLLAHGGLKGKSDELNYFLRFGYKAEAALFETYD